MQFLFELHNGKNSIFEGYVIDLFDATTYIYNEIKVQSAIYTGVDVAQFLDVTAKHNSITLIVILIFLMLLAFHHNGQIDDAFISYRYAQNLVEGNGLVWNPGENVEGYSNFLWVMLLAAGLKFGFAPENFSYFLAMPFHLIGLIFTYLLAKQLLVGRKEDFPDAQLQDKSDNHAINPNIWPLLVLLWVGTNHSLAAFAKSGMETSLQFMLFAAIAYVVTTSVQEGWNIRRIITTTILLNIAILTRHDSIILIVVAAWVFHKSHLKRFPTDAKAEDAGFKRMLDLSLFNLPFMLTFVTYFLWKNNFYGAMLPNSATVKLDGFAHAGYGLYYLYLFVICHLLAPFIIIAIWRGSWLLRTNVQVGGLAMFSLLWAGYIVFIGGDFMEFRFMVPVLPFLGIVIIYVLTRSIKNPAILTALAVLLLLGNVNSRFTLEKTVQGYGIEKAESLVSHVSGPEQNWVGIGKKLREMFEGTGVSIAAGAAGAIPYYSGLKAVDFLGLCDAEVPKIAEKFTIVPGHRIIAPLEYLVNRKVNLIIEPNNFMMSKRDFQMWVRLAGWRSMYKLNLNVDRPVNGKLINEALLLAIPIEPDHVLVVWYLTPHPAIEEAIGKYGLNRIRLERR